jgi:hypothetical protein
MTRTLITLLLLTLSSMAGICQVPGYLGKKITLQGEFHSFPALGGPTAHNRGLNTYNENGANKLGLNWSGGARLGYTVSRYRQVLLMLDYLKTGMTQTAYYQGFVDEYGSTDLFYNVTGLSFGLGTRKFRSAKGGLAPMGMYRGCSLSATSLKGKINDTYSDTILTPEQLGIDTKHLMLMAGFDFGTNYILKDKLLLNVGVKLNFALSPRAGSYIFNEGQTWDPYTNEKGLSDSEGNTENFRSAAAARYALHSVFMVYLGIGLIQ